MKNIFGNFVAQFSNKKGQVNLQGQVNPNFENDDDLPRLSKDGSDILQEEGRIKDETGKPREQWSNPIEFLLSCIAMSVGLGNVWRFPFTAYENGGGAFLIPYIIILIFVGKPLYYMELCMGQFASYGSVKVWAMVPAFKGVGYGQAVATWCVVTYYVSLMAVTVYYFFASFSSTLPWASCDQIEQCSAANANVSTAEIYYEEEVLNRYPHGLDDGIFLPEWRLTLCLLFSWIILFMVLVKGVKSSGKSAYFTALFPYVVLFILLGRGASLPGAVDGILFFITPQWEKLLEPQVWFKAVGQSFFSLSVGFGSIIMFSSYNSFRHNVYRDAIIISVVDTLTSLLAGFTIFAILGHLAAETGVSIDKVANGGGSGLAFISYPDVLARFDWVPQLFAVLFFLMLFTLGVGSASALAGCIITIISDDFPHLPRYIISLVVCVSGFLLGLFYVTPQGQYILDLVDYYGGNFIIYILTFLEVIAVQWVYGLKNFIRDIEFMLGRKTGIYWRFSWSIFIPLLLLVVFIYTLSSPGSLKSGQYVFGGGAHAFGILLTILALSFLPTFFIVAYLKAYKVKPSVKYAIKSSFKPTEKWSPSDPDLKTQYLEFIREKRERSSQLAEEYLCITGTISRKPSFHFRRILTEIKCYFMELFWND